MEQQILQYQYFQKSFYYLYKYQKFFILLKETTSFIKYITSHNLIIITNYPF